MGMWLRQSTASQEILLGKFVDSTDAVTAETALTIANTDIQLWKEGATTLANKNSGGATHISGGLYYAVLDATDTDTLGKLEVNVAVTGALAVRREFMVLPANVYDSLVAGTDTLQADVTQWLGTAAATPTTAGVPEVDVTHIGGSALSTTTAQLGVNVVQLSGDSVAADNAESFFDGTGYAGTNNVIPTVTTLTGHTPQTGDNYARLGAPAGASVSADIAAVKADTAAILLDTGTDGVVVAAASKTGYSLSSAGIQAIWDALTSALTTVGSIGKLIVDYLDAAVSSRNATVPLDASGTRAAIGLASANLDTQLAALPTDADVQTAAAAALTAYDPPTRAEATTDTNSILTRLGTPAGVDVSADIATLQTTADALPTLAEILAGGDVDGYTLEQTLKLCLAALAGKLSGAATTTITIRSADDTADRITATVDSDGNRTAVTLNAVG